MSLEKKLITPQSLVIEKTALELAAAYYEIGRSKGLKSRYKTPQAYAKKHVTNFIPKAVELLMDMLGRDSTPQDQKDMIYEAFMERTNDPELSNSGLPIFENNVAYKSDRHTPEKPIVINTKKVRSPGIEDLPLDLMTSTVSKKAIIPN